LLLSQVYAPKKSNMNVNELQSAKLNFARTATMSGVGPLIQHCLYPVRNRNSPGVACLAVQVNDRPMFLPLLNVTHLQEEQRNEDQSSQPDDQIRVCGVRGPEPSS
jgi:hypothetical protein